MQSDARMGRCLGALSVLLLGTGVGAAGPEILPALQKSAIKGGLCVVVGCADAQLSAEVTRSGTFLVHCLALHPQPVPAVREALLKQRLYGRGTVDACSGPETPYADNLVSLPIVLDAGPTGEAEFLRVLRPFAGNLVKQGAEFCTVAKPIAEGMDEWTHWRHGPDRKPVSSDKLVEVSERLQWLKWIPGIRLA